MVGPPASGKTKFARRFTKDNPEFIFCSIDNYRIKWKEERPAWQALFKDVQKNQNVILESCGLCHQLKQLFQSSRVKKQKRITIGFVGQEKELHKRLIKRQRERPIDYEYDFNDELAAISHVLENLNKCISPIDKVIDTSIHTIEEQYRILSKYIALKRIDRLKE